MSTDDLVIGRGELYFNRFIDGTSKGEGEMYLGSTPGFSISRTLTELERFTSYGGQQIQLESRIVRESHGARIITDNVSKDNLALWLGGTVGEGQDAVGYVNETFTVRRGRFYQLGETITGWGVRHVEPDIIFKLNGRTLPIEGNLLLDRVEGRFYVSLDATDLSDGATITVTFQWRRSPNAGSISPKPDEVRGSLRFLARNSVGPKNHVFFPSVRLAPVGQYDLKSDNWQRFEFDIDVRKLNPLAEYFIVSRTGDALYTADEQAIIDLSGINLDEFPAWDDKLNVIVNVDYPSANLSSPI